MLALSRGVGGVGVVAASYPKTIAASTQWNTFNPTSGGRRTYTNVTSYASPTGTDTPAGWTWPAGGPLNCPGYQLQLQTFEDRLEGINGQVANHHYDMDIGGGSAVITAASNAGSNPTSAWTNVTKTLTGAVHFHDWCSDHNGGTAFVGNVYLRYQYVRS